MASQADVRAGRAFVEVYLNKSLFTKGLKAMSSEIAKVGDGLKAFGTKMMAASAVLTVPMVAMAESWSESVNALGRAAERTGMTVQALGRLKFAASQADVEFEQLEVGITKMEKAVADASVGAGTAGVAFARMGLRVADLRGMSPDQQFLTIAHALSRIPDPAQRTARAMEIFGESNVKLLPLLNNIDQLTAKADRLGKLVTPEDVQLARDLHLAWKDLADAMGGIKNAIGSAIAPMLTDWVHGLTEIVVAVRDWVKSHKDLVRMVYSGATILAAAGAATVAFGFALKALSPIGNIVAAGFGLVGRVADAAFSVVTGAVKAVGFGLKLVWQGLSLVGQAIWLGVRGVGTLLSTAWSVGGAVARTLQSVGNVIFKVVNGIVDAAVTLVTVPLQAIGGLFAFLGPIAAALAPLAGLFVLIGVGGIAIRGVAQAIDSLPGAMKDWADTATAAANQGRAAWEHMGASLTQLRGSFDGFGSFFTGWGDLIGGIFRDVAGAAGRLFDDVKVALAGIQDAFATGNWKLMGDILKDTLIIAWGEISNVLGKHWDDLMGQLAKATGGLWYAFSTGWAWVAKEGKIAFQVVLQELKKIWSEILFAVSDALHSVVISLQGSGVGPMESLGNALSPLRQSLTESALKLGSEVAHAPSPEAISERENNAFTGGAEQRWRDAQQVVADTQAKLKELLGKPGTPQAEIDDARARLRVNAARAAKLKQDFDDANRVGPGAKAGEQFARLDIAGKILGTYSGLAATRTGAGPNPLLEVQKQAKKHLENIDRGQMRADQVERMMSIG